jgi:hypothetical protein
MTPHTTLDLVPLAITQQNLPERLKRHTVLFNNMLGYLSKLLTRRSKTIGPAIDSKNIRALGKTGI